MTKRGKIFFWLTIIFNLTVICVLVITLFLNSNNRKSEQLVNQKKELMLSSDSNSQLIQSYFIQQHHGILDRKEYIQSSSTLTLNDVMNYLLTSNSNDNILYQLLECEETYLDSEGNETYDSSYSRAGFKFYSTYTDSDNKQKLLFDNKHFYSYELVTNLGINIHNNEINDNIINATAQFTIPFKYYVNNASEARNCEQGMAIYTKITIKSINKEYFLLATFAMKDIISIGIPIVNYRNADCVLINSKGQYISYTSNLMSGNNDSFWSYLREVYGLESSEPDSIRKQIENNNSGSINILTGRNKDRQEATLVFNTLNNTNQWKYISIVPNTSLDTYQTDWSYAIIIIVFVLFLIIADGGIIITFSQKLKQSLRDTEKEAEKAFRATQSKSSFLSRMSHEIRTPLNAIIGYNLIAKNELETIRTEIDWRNSEAKFFNCLTKSDIASKHLLTIINDVLDMSAIESGKIKIANERFDFKELVSSLTTIFYSSARNKEVNFDVVFENQVDEWLIGDQVRINQILMNLLSNAIKFTSEGGSVILSIKKIKEENEKITVQFIVKDNGIGMSKEYLDRIWMPFEQADSSISRRFGGSGLGLTITKNLVDLMKGQISVESEIGVGSTFVVTLDLISTIELTKNNVYDFTKIKLLVVDDDANTCEYIHMLCMRYGVKCDTTMSGFEAIEMVRDAKTNDDQYTAILIDWKMPKISGIETAKRIKTITDEDIPIVIISAYDYTEIIDEASKAGIKKIISKPLFQSTLFDLLANLSGYNIEKIKSHKNDSNYKGNKILLVEDNLMNMEIAHHILKNAHFEVDKARDGFEAVDTFLNNKPGTYMCILMDIHMPGLNGLDATRQIRASEHPEATTIPIIAMTADAFAENVSEALEAGMNDHIAKPIQLDVLFATLNKYKK